jgi:hypothetical protein
VRTLVDSHLKSGRFTLKLEILMQALAPGSAEGRFTVSVEPGSGVRIVPAWSADPARKGQQACSVHMQMQLDPRMRMVPAAIINFVLRVRLS